MLRKRGGSNYRGIAIAIAFAPNGDFFANVNEVVDGIPPANGGNIKNSTPASATSCASP